MTLRDIAKRLNLSPSLVSGVLNERANVWASNETRARVLEAAQQAGYRPNAAARALRSGKTQTVALVYVYAEESLYRTGYLGVTETLADELGKIGYQLLVRVFTTQAALLADLTEMVRSRACDGIILWGREPDVEAQGILLESLHFPFVVKGRHETAHPDWFQAEYDHEAMMTGAAEHLASHGHRRIAYMGFDFNETFCLRLRDAFCAALLDVDADDPPEGLLSTSGNTRDEAEAQMARWLHLPPDVQPTALVIGSSEPAWQGVEIALARVGRRVGDSLPNFALTGITRPDARLLFGEARGLAADPTVLAADLMRDLLAPLLQNALLDSTIVRLLPPLLPVPGFHLRLAESS